MENFSSYIAEHQDTIFYFGNRGAMCLGNFAAEGAIFTGQTYTLRRTNRQYK